MTLFSRATPACPPRDVVAEFVASQLAQRDGWDQPHLFAGIHAAEGDKLTVSTLVGIHPSIHPTSYPDLLAGAAGKIVGEQPEQAPDLLGFLLEFEAHVVVAPADPTSREAEDFARDRAERRFHQRPDAQEVAAVYFIDVHRRMWVATHYRSTGQVRNTFYPDFGAPEAPGGSFVRALGLCAAAAASVLYGATIPAGR